MDPPTHSTGTSPLERRTSRARLRMAIVATLAAIALPYLGAVIGYSWSGEPIAEDLTRDATVGAAALCALAWGGLAIARFTTRVERCAAFAGKGKLVDDPEAIRLLLIQHDLTCPRCRYNLKGLPPGCCPECQEPIRLWVNSAEVAWPASRLAMVVMTACVLRGALGAINLYWAYVQWRFAAGGLPRRLAWWLMLTAGAHAVSVAAVLVVGFKFARWLRTPPGARRSAAAWVVAASGAAAIVLVEMLELAAMSLRW